METLSSSIASSWWAERSPVRHSAISAPWKVSTFRFGCFIARENFELLSISLCESSSLRKNRVRNLRVLALEVSGGGGTEEGAASNEAFLFESSTGHNSNHGRGIMGKPDLVTPGTSASGVTGSKPGLFRTPFSGGVHSATSAHDLPRPALAVRNLVEQARFAHLCTVMSRMHHRRVFYPFGSLVDFAPDPVGHPIFSLSPLAIHTRNLLADPRCTLVVQIPGWSGLSDARATIFGDIIPLLADQQEWAHKQFMAKHQQWASQQWGNFHYFRMQTISDIYFIGGFGTVAWVDVKEYESLQPDKIAANDGEQNLKELNEIFSKPLRKILSTEGEIDDAAFISIDSKGTDVRVRQGAQFNIQRLSFNADHGVETLEEAKKALQDIIDGGSKPRSNSRS